MKKRTAQEQKLADRAYLCAWRRRHREQLKVALAGIHRNVLKALLAQRKDLRSARELVDFISAQNWSAVDAGTRLIALHEINRAITALREARGLAPIDNPLPGAPASAFQIIKSIMTSLPPQAGEASQSQSRRIA
jgi:hypothetical protein